MKDYKKYLIREEESKENLLKVLDCNNEWAEQREDNFYVGIDTVWDDVDRKTFDIAFYLGDESANYNNELDCLTFEFVKRSLVGVDKEIIQYLENDLKDFDIIKDNKNYKVFFADNEVASFDTINECKIYIFDMLNVDRDLDISQFSIYQNLDMKGIK